MQLVYDVKEILNEEKTLQRFEDRDLAYKFAEESCINGKTVAIVPVILNDDFSDPTELTNK